VAAARDVFLTLCWAHVVTKVALDCQTPQKYPQVQHFGLHERQQHGGERQIPILSSLDQTNIRKHIEASTMLALIQIAAMQKLNNI